MAADVPECQRVVLQKWLVFQGTFMQYCVKIALHCLVSDAKYG